MSDTATPPTPTRKATLSEQLGGILTREREKRGTSRRAFAEALGVADVTLLQYEKGRVNPTLAKAEELADQYGLELTIVARKKR